MTAHYEVAESVATITLDAPQRRNALNAEMLSQVRAHLDAAGTDASVRCVVLSHTGSVFCSGMDLSQVGATAAGDQPIMAFPSLLTQIWDFPKPVIARINGKARAGGIGLLTACDIALASSLADFAFTEVRLGLVPAVISVPILARVAVRITEELFLTGETFDALRALEMGLLNAVAPDVDAEVARYTAMLRMCEPKALAATKAMMRRDRSSISMADDYTLMSELSAGFFASPEAKEGIAAFAAKRSPRWAE